MPTLRHILLLSLLFSCQENAGVKEKSVLKPTPANPDTIKTSTLHPDTPTTTIPKSDSILPPSPDYSYAFPLSEAKNRIDSLLSRPFELHRFKSKKMGSLSGQIYFRKYHFKPPGDGVGYRYFMFNPKKFIYASGGQRLMQAKTGYLGTDRKTPVMIENGLVIKTFQPEGKYMHQWNNPDEILIEVVSKYNDYDLPELAFVGLDSATIRKMLGLESFYKNGCLVYTKHNAALILHLRDSKVEWLKYIRLSEELDAGKEFKGLYEAK